MGVEDWLQLYIIVLSWITGYETSPAHSSRLLLVDSRFQPSMGSIDLGLTIP